MGILFLNASSSVAEEPRLKALQAEEHTLEVVGVSPD